MRRRTVDAVMLQQRAESFAKRSIKSASKAAGLRLAMSMLDLTTLEGKDSPQKVRGLCRKAVRPYDGDIDPPIPSVAAVCVYPALVAIAKEELAGSTVKIASVATGFPSGQFPLDIRLRDVREAIDAGADEIDMVINRGAFLAGRYDEVAEEIRQVRSALVPPPLREGERGWVKSTGQTKGPDSTGSSHPHPNPLPQGRGDDASGWVKSSDQSEVSQTSEASHPHPGPPPQGGGETAAVALKIILETGELETYDNVRFACDLAIEAALKAGPIRDGEVFLKTSTGKVAPAATMPVTLILLESIRDHFLATGVRLGCKPAGGIRSAKQALHYLVMVKETLGEDWLTPDLFRFGASSLANDLLRQIIRQSTGRYAASYDFSEA